MAIEIVDLPIKNDDVGVTIPNIWKVIKAMFQTNNQFLTSIQWEISRILKWSYVRTI